MGTSAVVLLPALFTDSKILALGPHAGKTGHFAVSAVKKLQ
jgi:hypothetical protein